MNLDTLRERLMLGKGYSNAVYLHRILEYTRFGRFFPAFEEHIQIPQW